MASWKNDNTLNKFRESEVEWKRCEPKQLGDLTTYKAEGYPVIRDYYTGAYRGTRKGCSWCSSKHRFQIFDVDMGFKKFETLKDAKAWAEAHPLESNKSIKKE